MQLELKNRGDYYLITAVYDNGDVVNIKIKTDKPEASFNLVPDKGSARLATFSEAQNEMIITKA